ncbi:hypothetical protein, partial [Desulfovibrio piger]|uniref:hypothetical protein n=2 Tax=Desulfovibrio TaxID=872 RepID=UPI00307F86A1
LPELDPEPSVSTNSTTSAQQFVYAISVPLASLFCQPFPVLRKAVFFIFYFQYDGVMFDRRSASG